MAEHLFSGDTECYSQISESMDDVSDDNDYMESPSSIATMENQEHEEELYRFTVFGETGTVYC